MFVFFTLKMAVFYPSLTLIYWQFLPFISPEKMTLSPLFQPLKLIVYARFFHIENGSHPPFSHPHNPVVSSSYLFTCCEEWDAPITDKFNIMFPVFLFPLSMHVGMWPLLKPVRPS